jgi:hypothetical protein
MAALSFFSPTFRSLVLASGSSLFFYRRIIIQRLDGIAYTPAAAATFLQPIEQPTDVFGVLPAI